MVTSLVLPELEIAADRPFIFTIRHIDALDVLFFGAYKNPSASGVVEPKPKSNERVAIAYGTEQRGRDAPHPDECWK